MSVIGASAGTTLHGPGGVLISLGIETLSTMGFLTPQMVTFYYNIFSIFVMMIIAISASQRDLKFLNIFLPIWAGVAVFAGWLQYPDPAVGFALIIVATILAIGNYFADTLHEKHGIAGPGNKVILIFKFLVILQCVVVFVNSAAIFPSDVGWLSPSNPSYANIDLDAQMVGMNSSGGLTALIVDIATIAAQIAASAVLLAIKCLISLALFSVILSQVFPWIVMAGTIGYAFLVIVQFAIWTMYLLFVFTIFYRPSPDPGF